MSGTRPDTKTNTVARAGYSLESLQDGTRVLTLGIVVLLANLLLGSRYLPTTTYFWGLGLSRLGLAVLLAFVPATNCGRFRPLVAVGCLLTLLPLPTSLFTFLLTYLLLEITVDTLTVEFSTEQDIPLQFGFFAALRTLGLWLGLLLQNSGLNLPLGLPQLRQACLAAFLIFWLMVKEKKSDRQVCSGLVSTEVPAKTRLTDTLHFLSQPRALAALANLTLVALLAGSLTHGVLPYPLLYPDQATGWFLGVLSTVKLIGLGLIWTWLIEKLPLGFQLLTASSACLLCALSPALSLERWQDYLMGALLGGILTGCRAVLRETHRVQASLRSSILVTIWIVGCLGGETLAATLSTTQLNRVAGLFAVGFVLYSLLSLGHYSQKAKKQEKQSLERSERFGDRTLDFEGAPGPPPRRGRWNPFRGLFDLLFVNLPVKIFLALTIAFFLTLGISLYQRKASFQHELESSVKVFRTKLFLSAIKRRLTEEMLASRRVPTDWSSFIAGTFHSEGKPLDDIDPWGNPYRFTTTDSQVLIVSAGPDQRYGSADDLEQAVDKPSGVR